MTEGVRKVMFIRRMNFSTVVVAIVIAGGTHLIVRTAVGTATAQEEKKGNDTPTSVSDNGRPPLGDQEKEAAASAAAEASVKAALPANLNATDPTIATELAKFEGSWVLVSSERKGQTTSEEKNP